MVRHYAQLLEKSGNMPAADGEMYAGIAAAIEGQLRGAESYFFRSVERARIESPSNALRIGALFGEILAVQRDRAAARAYLRKLTTSIPPGSMDVLDRPYEQLVIAYARAGDFAAARHLLAESDRLVPPRDLHARASRALARGILALSEGKYAGAVRQLYAADSGVCLVCALRELALAYDRAENHDSAIAGYEQYLSVAARYRGRGTVDAIALPHALRRLGELYEERGENDKALDYFRQFVDLRKSADAALQSEVSEVRAHITGLTAGERKTAARG